MSITYNCNCFLSKYMIKSYQDRRIIMEYLKYIMPPLIGAVIGYVTNWIAVKMMFRPLKEIKIGNVIIGGNHPVAIQSMTNTPTKDINKTVKQVKNRICGFRCS